jgi:starch phosphorylase
METLEQNIRRLSDAKLWQFRMASSQPLIDYARQRRRLNEMSAARRQALFGLTVANRHGNAGLKSNT